MSENITLHFLRNLLKNDYHDVTIQEYEITPGSNRGDNYTSMLYRITLKGFLKHIEPDGSSEDESPWQGSLIYKCLPESQLRKEAFKSDKLFCNEVAFYTKIWPALSKFQSQFNIKNPFKAIPKCYLAQSDLIILQDLKPLGFYMPDRRMGLSIEQSYFVVKQLSQFHALSLAMKYHNSDEFYELLHANDGITETFFEMENKEYYRSYYTEAIKNAINMLEEETAQNNEEIIYLNKFVEFCDEARFFERMVDLVVAQEPLAVITHGDCWTNNFLFKYVDREVVEMYMVDFQIVRYASPTLDLAYIVYLCLDREQRKDHLHSIVEYYTDELHNRLVELSDEGSVFHTALNRDALYQMMANNMTVHLVLGHFRHPWTPDSLEVYPVRYHPHYLLTMIHEEFKRASLFALGISLDMYPIMNCNSDEAPNLYQAKEVGAPSHEEAKPVFTSNSTCRKKMMDLVKELVDNNLL